jgi:hypothetical protein
MVGVLPTLRSTPFLRAGWGGVITFEEGLTGKLNRILPLRKGF